jgi:hypothetical protein
MTTDMTDWAIHFFVPVTLSDENPVAAEHLTYIGEYATRLFGRCTIFPLLEGIKVRSGGFFTCDKRVGIVVRADETLPDLFDRIIKLGVVVLDRFQQSEVFIVGQDVSMLSLNERLRAALTA